MKEKRTTSLSSLLTTVPELIDPSFGLVFAFSVIENERFELDFAKTGSINSGTVHPACTLGEKVFRL
jgi:hypothetical protein